MFRRNNQNSNKSLFEAVFLHEWRPYLWIFLLTFGVYVQTLGYDFSPLDDPILIVYNIDWLKNISNLPSLFTGTVFEDQYYRPILNISFMVDALTGRGNPLPFHLTNIIFHIIASLLLFQLLNKLKLNLQSAFFLAVVFAVHPIHVNAVAWIPGRNDTILAIFCIASLVSFMNYLSSKKMNWFMLHLIFFILALLTKESAIVLPVILFSFYWLFENKQLRKEMFILLNSWILIVIIWLIIRNSIVNDYQGIKLGNSHDIVINILYVITMCFEKLVIPVNQSVIPALRETSLIPGLIVILLIIFIVIKLGITDMKRTIFGTIWFLLFIFIPLIHGPTNSKWEYYEHRFYIPAIGLLISLSQLDFNKVLIRNKKIFYASLIILISLLFLKTFYRSKIYRTPHEFAEAAVRESPNVAKSYQIRGNVFAEMKEYKMALEDYFKALEINPEYEDTYYNRGNVLLNMKEYKMALEDYNKVLKLNDKSADVYANRGLIFEKMENYDKAFEDYSKALDINPLLAKVYNNRGLLFEKIQNYDRAVEDYNKALEIDSLLIKVYYNRGSLFEKMQKYERAVKDYSKAIEINPQFIDAYNNRAVVFYYMGEYDKAWADVRLVQKLGANIDAAFLQELKSVINSRE